MIVIPAALAGALWGGLLARRRKGNGYDIAQYAAGYGIAFALLGLFASVLLDRLY
ncbi:hypothetical protein Ga0609869_002755 [Rhodovulum iodosum]|uniref:Apolipoprotein acyltransferase n=1 Tax=Rhodovulum iodosum TaxID=68291 RepID=A0ABV3XYG6_9RHOB|nr:apolipoprotein acyltransferase [Rhodovulum robiginosum]RSK33430.1 apolipoprotein acyltransferase [Rhodovulum robiginosum]